MSKVNYLIAISILIAACTQTDSKERSKIDNSRIIERTIDNKENEITVFKDSVNIDKEEKLNADEGQIPSSEEEFTKAYVIKSDSSIHLTGNINHDYRIFGYEKPDTTSNKLLLFSVFTNDVEKNPFNCELGAYYGTSGMDNIRLKYLQTTSDFIKAVAIDNLNKSRTIFFEEEWIKFEE